MTQVTIQQAMAMAMQRQQAGRLAEAEQIYRQILLQQPGHAEALHLLGVIAHQTGRQEMAVDLIGRAVALVPGYADGHNTLGIVLNILGRSQEAAGEFRRAIGLKPDYPEAYNNLGIALRDLGHLDEAIGAYQRAIALAPAYAQAYSNLGIALREKGQLDEAAAAHRRAIACDPLYAEAHSNLGNVLREKGELDEAIAEHRRAIACNPAYPKAHSNLGAVLRDKGRYDEAVAACRQAIALQPDYAQAHYNLGVALKDQGRIAEAEAAFRRAIALQPRFAEAHSNLGLALAEMGRSDEAVGACQRAIEINPGLAEAYDHLGTVLKRTGQVEEAVAAFRGAVAIKPNLLHAHSNLVFLLSYQAGIGAEEIGAELRGWSRRHAEPLKKLLRPHDNDRDTERRLRIGYVSPDLREHSVGRLLLPLLANHDKRQVEVFAYAEVRQPDEFTTRLRGHIDHWKNTVGVGDADLAEMIRADRIDVLVDLALHTPGNRLLVFARKPAPVQVTYLAYCSSSGLAAMDYRLSDPYLDPPGREDPMYSERTIRLPETYWCYQPSAEPRAASPLPALERGYVTLGCLNNFCKVSGPVVAAWARVMRALPGSRLLVHASEGAHRLVFLKRLAGEGIQAERVRFSPPVPMAAYFQLYEEIDIALDPFPYGGGTTTCDALWMGVPVVSLVGKMAVGRGGLSILSNVGLPELVARSEEEYVRIAVELARAVERLKELRATLRQRMEESPLMDAPRFARNVEGAYREMWRRWCGASVRR